MSSALEIRAEAFKLARVLGGEPAEFEFLERASAEDLRALREQVTEALFRGDYDRFSKVALAAKVVPAPLAATIARHALGPLLCARVAGLVDAPKAIEIARRLPAAFLADVAVELDPRRAAEVIAQVPAALVAEVAAELARLGEHVTMGRFVGYLNDEALRAAAAEIPDPDLLRIAFTMEGKERLDDLIALLPPARLPGILNAAEREQLWPEALDLLAQLSPQRAGSLADIAAQEGLLDSLARTTVARRVWDVVLPVAPEMSAGTQAEVAKFAATLDQPDLIEIAKTVDRNGLWAVFVSLAADHMDAGGRERVADVVAEIDEQIISGLADAVERDALWAPLLRIAEQMRPDQLSRIADRLLAAGLDERLPSLIHAVEQTGLWETGLRMLAGLDSGLKERLAPVAAELSSTDRTRVVEHARELGLLGELGPIEAMLTG